MRIFEASRLQLVLVVVLALALPTLAAFQYRWLEDLRQAVHDRMQINLRLATFYFGREFDSALAHVYRSFQVDAREEASPQEQIALQYREWVNEASFPGIVGPIYWVDHHETRGLTISEFTGADHLVPLSAWPREIAHLERSFFDALEYSDRQHAELVGPEPLHPDIPALVVQQILYRTRDSLPEEREIAWIVAVLNRGVLVGEFLPALAEEYYSFDDALEFNLAVVDPRDPEQVVYASSPGLEPGSLDAPEAETDLYQLRYWDFPQSRWWNRRTWTVVGDHVEPAWKLLVQHRAGSLDAHLAAVRDRNFLISLGVLLLLGGAVLMIVVSTRRAQRLASQQMEFVAGISHELRTPLTVIRSASENLTDVAHHDPLRTRRYGEVIGREGRRLTQMVEHVLLFSRMQSGHYRYEKRPVDVGALLREAAEASEAVANEHDVRVDVRLPDALPLLQADGPALGSAFQNLLSNAIKYGPAGSTVTLRARLAEGADGREVQVVVEDEGQGIDKADLPHLFEPFYRGRNARRSQIDGSGLGLNLVQRIIQAHRGRVGVAATGRSGTTFLVQLPLETPEAPAADPVAEPTGP